MFKRLMAIGLMMVAGVASAQIPAGFVQTTATVPSLSGGTYGASWTNLSSSSQLPLLGGVSTFQTTVSGKFDSNGYMSVLLADNSQVIPNPSAWTFSLSFACGGNQGSGFTVQVTITGGGGTQDISSQITAALPTNPCQGTGGSGTINPGTIGYIAQYSGTSNPTQTVSAIQSVPVANGGTGATTSTAALGNLFSGVNSPAYLQSGNSSSQYAAQTATATCSADPTNGTITVIPVIFGQGYVTAPTVTVSGVPSGASVGTVTANLTGSQVTSYTVSSSSGFQNSTPSQGCPVVITVASPPTPTAPVANILQSNAVTAFQAGIRVDDFGCVGDGVTDDTLCFNNAIQYAATQKSKAVILTQGKNYFLGSFTGTYRAGGDNGVVPVAATLNCTASAGVVTGCSVSNGGYGMLSTSNTIKTNASGSGSGATFTATMTACTTSACPSGSNGYYVSGISASGGTGYPNSFTEYIGPTCNSQPCSNLSPNYAYVGYSVDVPAYVTIEGNGASVSGGFTTSAKTTYPYKTETTNPGSSWPYGTLFYFEKYGQTVRDLKVVNAFIGFQYSGFDFFANIETSGDGLLFQAQNAQGDTFQNISSQNNTTWAGWFLGGQQVDRSPFYGQNVSSSVNNYNLADGLIINNYTQFGPGAGSSTATFNAQRRAFDCWFDQNFTHLEDSGWSTSDNCYTPVGYTTLGGTTARMTDQDIASLPESDFQFRTVYGTAVTFLSMYGRPFIGSDIENFNVKYNPGYALNLTALQNALIKNIGEELDGHCTSSYNFGSSYCPNPYEPFNVVTPGVILAQNSSPSSVTFDTIDQSNDVPCAVALPWSSGISWSNSNFNILNIRKSGNCLAETPGVGPNVPGFDSAIQDLAASQGSPQGTSQVSSESYNWTSSRYAYGIGGRPNLWQASANDGLYFQTPTSTRSYNVSILEFANSYNENLASPGYSSVKMPGLVVDSNSMAGGQVTAITVNTSGSGYIPYSHVNCSMTPAPQEFPGTTITGTNLVSGSDTWSTGANWSGSFASGWTHTAGASDTIVDTTFVPVVGNFYIVSVTISGTPTAIPVTVSLGGYTSKNYGINGTYTFRVIPSSTASLTITAANSGFNGKVSAVTVVNISASNAYQATCDAYAGASGGVQKISVIYPALGYVSAPAVTLDFPKLYGVSTAVTSTSITANASWVTNAYVGDVITSGGVTATITGNTSNTLTFSGGWSGSTPSAGPFTIALSGTAGTATATVNGIDSYNPIGHLISDTTYLSSAGSVGAFSSVTITGVSCPNVAYLSSTSSGNDAVSVTQPGEAFGVIPTLQAVAWPTASGVCTLNLRNPTNTSISYLQGPWVFQATGTLGGNPNVSYSNSTATADSTSVAAGSAAQGGTGINTSSSTGIPSISGGVWSVSTALPDGTLTDTLGYIPTLTAPTVTTGLTWYDQNVDSTAYYNSTGYEVNPGQEVDQVVYNPTGSTIQAGQPVYITGHGSGSYATYAAVNLASAYPSAATANAIGLTGQSIAPGGVGIVVILGSLSGFNTNSIVGTQLAAGTSTSVGSTTLTDTSQSWTVNAYAGDVVFTGSVYGVISSNTSNTLTISSWSGSTPSTGAYTINSPASAGNTVYLASSPAGFLTTVQPTSPSYAVRIGFVITAGTSGEMFASVRNVYTIGSNIISPANFTANSTSSTAVNVYGYSSGQLADIMDVWNYSGGSKILSITETGMTLVNPALGTPASGVITNLTGTCTSCTANSVSNSVTFNNSGSGATSGTTYNGSSAQTVSYNTVGASPTTSVCDFTYNSTVTTISGTCSATGNGTAGTPYVFTIPTNASEIKVYAFGGGAGGGGGATCSSASTCYGGGGGSSGSTQYLDVPVSYFGATTGTPGATLQITIGQGGTAGTSVTGVGSGGNGGYGGTSIVKGIYSSTTYGTLVAEGSSSGSGNPGSGGTASSGTAGGSAGYPTFTGCAGSAGGSAAGGSPQCSAVNTASGGGAGGGGCVSNTASAGGNQAGPNGQELRYSLSPTGITGGAAGGTTGGNGSTPAYPNVINNSAFMSALGGTGGGAGTSTGGTGGTGMFPGGGGAGGGASCNSGTSGAGGAGGAGLVRVIIQ